MKHPILRLVFQLLSLTLLSGLYFYGNIVLASSVLQAKITWSNQVDLGDLVNANHYTPSGGGIQSDKTVVILWTRRDYDGSPDTDWPVILTWRDPLTLEWNKKVITTVFGNRYLWVMHDDRILIGMGNYNPGFSSNFRNDLFIVESDFSTVTEVAQTQPVPHSGSNGTHAGLGVFNPSGITLKGGRYLFHGAGDHYCGNISDFYIADSHEGAKIWKHYNLPSSVGTRDAQALKLNESQVLIIGGATQSGCSGYTLTSVHYLIDISEEGIPSYTTLTPRNSFDGRVGTTFHLSDGTIANFSYYNGSESPYVVNGVRILDPHLTRWESTNALVESGTPHPYWRYFFERHRSIVELGNDHFLLVGGCFENTPTCHSKVTEMHLEVETLAHGLAAYYPFTGNANDASDNSNDGTVNGASLTTDQSGSNGQAYDFTRLQGGSVGSGDYIEIPHSSDLHFTAASDSYSISVWARPDLDTTDVIHTIIEDRSQNLQLSYGINYTNNQFQFVTRNGTDSSIYVETLNSYPPQQWYHLVLWVKDGILKGYVNQELVGSVDVSTSTNTENTQSIQIGRARGNNGFRNYFDGKIDQIRIYQRALTESEIQSLYEQEKIDQSAQTYGNLIIVAGGGLHSDNSLKEATQYLSNYVYQKFLGRYFLDQDIYYLNPAQEHDIDGDGQFDDIVDSTELTVENFGNAITDWAAQQTSQGPLYIYLNDHGGDKGFGLSHGVTMSSSELAAFLDTFQNTTNRQVVVMIEACKSGTFLEDLSGNDRLIITSSDEKDSYMNSTGEISFSQPFFSYLYAGETFQEAFHLATQQLKNSGRPYNHQSPQFQDNGNLSSLQVGGDFLISNFLPQITDYTKPTTEDSANTSFPLFAKVTALDQIKEVTAVITPPDFVPPSLSADFSSPRFTLTRVTLTYKKDDQNNLDGRYEGHFPATTNGRYQIIFTVRDQNDHVVSSPPVFLDITGGTDAVVWQLVSLTERLPASPENFFTLSQKEQIRTLWEWQNNQWKLWSPTLSIEQLNEALGGAHFEEITQLELGKGYWINGKSYMAFSEETSSDFTQNLERGWNLVGFHKSQEMSLANYLEQNPTVDSVWSWGNDEWYAHFRKAIDTPFPQLLRIQSGKGYWVKAR